MLMAVMYVCVTVITSSVLCRAALAAVCLLMQSVKVMRLQQLVNQLNHDTFCHSDILT